MPAEKSLSSYTKIFHVITSEEWRSDIFFPISFSVFMCKYVHVAICVCGSVCGVTTVNVRCLSQSLSTLVFEEGSLTA